MREYEYETGRFISIDPLWANYYGWSPYQYSMNSPVYNFDNNGGADFIRNGGSIMSDNVNDGLLFATSDFALNSSITQTFDGGPGLDFETLKSVSYQLPDKATMRTILSYHQPRAYGEGGGVGGNNFYYYGGENLTGRPPNASNEVMNAIGLAASNGDLMDVTYYIHDHPFMKDGNIVKNVTPSPGADREAITNLYNAGAKNIRFGILFNLDKVNIFGQVSSQDVIFNRKILENYISE